MRAGSWDNGTMAALYLLRLPRQHMRVLTSFGSTAGSYFLKHAAVSRSGFFARSGPWWTSPPRRTWEVRSVPQISLAGSFISLLKSLRLIFLQDAAILQPIYLNLPPWRLPIFRDPEWYAFVEAVCHCQEAEEEPADVRMRAVMPAIAEAVHGAINRASALLVDTRAITASQTGAVLQEKSFTGGCRRGSRKNLQLPHVISTTSEKKPDLPPSGLDPSSDTDIVRFSYF
jgi:hypothetical protein